MSRQTVSKCVCDYCGKVELAENFIPDEWGSINATVYGAGYGEQSNSGEVLYCGSCLATAGVGHVFYALDVRRQIIRDHGGTP